MNKREIKFKRYHFDHEGKCIGVSEWGFIDGGFVAPSTRSGSDASRFIDCQFTGLLDKNGKEIYDGDKVQGYRMETEYQTHYGDNIPLGSYTEPCDVIAKKLTGIVTFFHCGFTTSPDHPPYDEDEDYKYTPCLLNDMQLHTRKTLEEIMFPKPYFRQNEVESDEDFLDVAKDIAAELGNKIETIQEFIDMINGIEIIGNQFQNPELA